MVLIRNFDLTYVHNKVLFRKSMPKLIHQIDPRRCRTPTTATTTTTTKSSTSSYPDCRSKPGSVLRSRVWVIFHIAGQISQNRGYDFYPRKQHFQISISHLICPIFSPKFPEIVTLTPGFATHQYLKPHI
jgi:hypothetical protein